MKRFYDNEGEYGHYLMQELKLPAVHGTPEALRDYEIHGKKRIHWMDSENMPGSIQINSSWYVSADPVIPADSPEAAEEYLKANVHVHDTDEIVAYYGGDPEDPENLNGIIETVIGDEIHILTKSTMLFIPAGLPHSLPYLKKVDRPIFHFSFVLSKSYGYVRDDGSEFQTR